MQSDSQVVRTVTSLWSQSKSKRKLYVYVYVEVHPLQVITITKDFILFTHREVLGKG